VIDQTGLEHPGQITRITLEEPDSMSITNVASKKVNRKKMEEELKRLEVGQGKGEKTYEGMIRIMESLPEGRRCRGKNEWWTEELEKINKDMKVMRRKGDKDWKLVRKVFRKRMINTRYEHMKDILSKNKDNDIFKIVKCLEGQRVIPPMMMGDGTKVFQHDQIGHLIAEQLQPGEETEFERSTVDMRLTKEELKSALDTLLRNAAARIDQMSYLLLRLLYKVDNKKMLEGLESMLREDLKSWHKAETVLIKKGDKERYDMVKSWRMIHLLWVVAQVIERVILNKMVKEVDLEDTQYGSRNNRSTHDMFKQIYEYVDYNKDMKCGMLSLDVEGGFDKVDIKLLCQILIGRGCSSELTEWVKRWTMNRCVRLRFNGRRTKDYHLNREVPQGLLLLPFLFGIYVADIFRPRIHPSINFRAMISSYIDDGAILISTDQIHSTKEKLMEYFQLCNRVAKERGMSFSPNKIQ